MRLRGPVSLTHIATNFSFVLFFTFALATTAEAGTTQVSGAVETEVMTSEEFDGTKMSDIILSVFELSLDSEVSEWVSAHVVLLYEEDDTPLEVDQGWVEIGNSFLSGFNFQIGQVYLPFGAFETNLVSDPLTLEIAETRESAVVISYENGFYASFFMFNGDMMEPDADDGIDNMGFNLGYALEGEEFSMDIGFSYISNMGDSDGLSGVIQENTGDVVMPEYVPGVMSHLIINWGSFAFIGELAAATKEFEEDLIYAGRKSKPSAANLEIAFGVTDDITVALAMQNTVDLAGVLPENRVLLGVAYSVNDETLLAVEFRSDSDYEQADGGTGNTGSGIMVHFGTAF